MPHQLFQLGIKALIHVGNEYLFLTKVRAKDAIHFFDIPGGRVEQVTDNSFTGIIATTLQREIVEELGVHISLDIIEKATKSPLVFSVLERFTHEGNALALVVYHIELAEKPEISLSDEHNGYRWVAQNDLDSILRDEAYEANDIIERIVSRISSTTI